MPDPHAIPDRAATYRPRFSDIDKRLLLAAVREMHKRDRGDRDWRRLTVTFGRLCGYEPEEVLDDNLTLSEGGYPTDDEIREELADD